MSESENKLIYSAGEKVSTYIIQLLLISVLKAIKSKINLEK